MKEFSKGFYKPQLFAYEIKFKNLDIEKIEPTFIIGAMQLKTHSLIVRPY